MPVRSRTDPAHPPADRQNREPPVPAELAAALQAAPQAAQLFAALPPSHRNQYGAWVGGASKPQTRLDRAQRAIGMILARAAATRADP